MNAQKQLTENFFRSCLFNNHFANIPVCLEHPGYFEAKCWFIKMDSAAEGWASMTNKPQKNSIFMRIKNFISK